MNRDLFEDMENSLWFKEKIKEDRYAQNVYAALCNTQWQAQEVWTILKEELWQTSWRGAGGIVADLRESEETYMDWYCSGIGSDDIGYGLTGRTGKGFVSESVITDEIAEDFARLGWRSVPWSKDKKI